MRMQDAKNWHSTKTDRADGNLQILVETLLRSRLRPPFSLDNSELILTSRSRRSLAVSAGTLDTKVFRYLH